MAQSDGKTKAYENVLDKLKDYIKENELQPGDRLPSERELVEHLNAGRSSVREGLRAIELLGLIETKRGEGTFLRTYQSHRTLALLATFIFQDPNTKNEIVQVKKKIEKEATKLAFKYNRLQVIAEWQKLVGAQRETLSSNHQAFYQVIFSHAKNELLNKMWSLMDEFVETFQLQACSTGFYLKLTDLFVNNHYEGIEILYEQFDME